MPNIIIVAAVTLIIGFVDKFLRHIESLEIIYNDYSYTTWRSGVPNDVIMWHPNDIELSCQPGCPIVGSVRLKFVAHIY